MSLNHLGSYSLGGINIGLAAGIGLLNPLLAQFEVLLNGQFGLGAMLADVQMQFNGAISAVAQLGINLSNPLQAIQMLILAAGQLAAALSMALSFGLPTVALQIGLQIAAIAALTGALAIRLGGIKALVSAAAAVKIPVVKYIAQMSAALSAGPAHLLAFDGSSLGVTGGQISAQCLAGLGPTDPIAPGDMVSGILIVTKDPAVFAALGLLLRTT